MGTSHPRVEGIPSSCEGGIEQTLNLEDYAKRLENAKCPCCGGSLAGKWIEMYPHDGGWDVEGYTRKQWLSVRCCRMDWSLWKIGIRGSVEHP